VHHLHHRFDVTLIVRIVARLLVPLPRALHCSRSVCAVIVEWR
jgi:hypothetical protein